MTEAAHGNATTPADPNASDPRINDANHPVWKQSFSYQVRHDLIDTDLEASRNVVRLLLVIVAGGLVLGAIGVMASMALLS